VDQVWDRFFGWVFSGFRVRGVNLFDDIC